MLNLSLPMLTALAEAESAASQTSDYMGGLLILGVVVAGLAILATTKNISRKQPQLKDVLDGREKIFIDRTAQTKDGEVLRSLAEALLAKIRACRLAGDYESVRSAFMPKAYESLLMRAEASKTAPSRLVRVDASWVECADDSSACVYVKATLEAADGQQRNMLYRFTFGPTAWDRRITDYTVMRCPVNMKVETL